MWLCMIHISAIDRILISSMRARGIPALRVSLGIIFLWFGALKVFGVSPVTELIGRTYSFLPQPELLVLLGTWEVIIGAGLLMKFALRATLALLWLQMAGTLIAPVLAPNIFFTGGNPFLLTVEGEFVLKNLVLISAGIVIGGYMVRPRNPS